MLRNIQWAQPRSGTYLQKWHREVWYIGGEGHMTLLEAVMEGSQPQVNTGSWNGEGRLLCSLQRDGSLVHILVLVC